MKTANSLCLFGAGSICELTLTRLNGDPIPEGKPTILRFATNGRVWVCNSDEGDDGFRLATKQELEDMFGPMVKRYGLST